MRDSRGYTVTDIAEIIAEAGGMSEERQSRLHRQIRNFANKDMLFPTGTIDGRGTMLFDLKSVYLCRVLVVFADHGFDAEILREVARAARSHDAQPSHPPSSRVEGGGYLFQGGLGNAIRGVAKGERWSVRLRTRSPWLSRFAEHKATFEWDGGRDEASEERVSGTLGPILAQTIVPLNALFADLPEVEA